MLKINNLSASVDEGQKVILTDLSLEIPSGEVHAIMGPNGAGKSTLSYVLTGREGYDVTGGDVTLDGDDYVSNASDAAIRNFALRGIREIGFDLGKKIRSIKVSIDTTNDTVALPSDYVDLTKLGVVDEDGIIRPLIQNNNINYSSKEKSPASTTDSSAGPLDISQNIIIAYYSTVC